MPEWTPTDMRSSTGPTELSALPISSIVHCMSEAAPARALGVPLADEEQEQRVAAELEHVAAVALGDRDQLVEDGRDAADELLGAGLAVDREPLGERGEAGDVDRDERAVETRARGASGSSLQARTSRGRYGRESPRVAEEVSVTTSAWRIRASFTTAPTGNPPALALARRSP